MESRSSNLCFTTVLGQEKAGKLVTRTLNSGRLPHAYIFKGPDGVGKKLFAKGLAAALNCREKTGIGACGVCSSCKKMQSGNHPDFMVIGPDKGAIKIGQVRAMCRSLSYPPYESPLRIVVLEDVHTMRQEAANSLLKTLEEPPADNLLILTTEASQEILTTLSSRCQTIPFYGLVIDDAASIIKAHQPEMEAETARLLARLAEGSPGRALLFNTTDMIAVLQSVIDVVSAEDAHTNQNIGVLLKAAEKTAELKDQLPLFLGLLRVWLRDQLVTEAKPGPRQHAIQLPWASASGPKSWSSEELFAKLRAVDRAEKELARNCNRILVCEVLLFHLA